MESVATLLLAPKPQAEHPLPLTFTDPQPNAMRQLPVETEIVQPAQPEATVAPTPTLTARHAHDAVFEQRGDGVLDVLAWNLLR